MDALWTGPMRRPSVQRFSSEVASASLWMFTGLILQAVVNSCKVGKYVPSALIFSVPFIISKNWGFTHLTLPVRIMEWTMGRFHLKRVFMYTVAHCFGYFFGLVLFHLMADALGTLPYVGCLSGHLSVQNALNVLPGVGILGEQVPTNAAGIACDTMGVCSGTGNGEEETHFSVSVPVLVADSIATSLHGLVMIIVPEILIVNKISVTATVPMLCAAIALTHSLVGANVLGFPGNSMLNPVASGVIEYGKWLDAANPGSASFQKSFILPLGATGPLINFQKSNVLAAPLLFGGLKFIISPHTITHFAGIVGGGIIAGTLANVLYPDDPAAWKSWRQA